MRIFTLLFLFLLTCSLSAGAKANLVPNPGLASKDGFLPDRWSGIRSAKGIHAYKTNSGILRISGKTANYASYAGFRVNIESGKSYYFSCEMKSDRLTHRAGVFYSLFGADRKVLVSSRPLLGKYTGPQKEWVKIAFIIPSASVPDAKSLSVSFVVYNTLKKPGEDRGISFRNPVLTVYAGEKAVMPPATASASTSEAMPDHPFSGNLTGFPIGTPYLLEKNGVGFFRLNSGSMPRRKIVVTVKHPKGVNSELYIWNRSKGECVNVPGTGGRYTIGREYDWLIWSNCLIFTADKTVPERFNIDMTFECGAKKISYKIPVQQIAEYKNKALPVKRRFNSWQSFPVLRIDTAQPANKLGRALEQYWKRSGWFHTRHREIVNMIPYAWNPKKVDLRQAVDIAGTPVPLYCDSAMISAGADFFKNVFEKQKQTQAIASATHITWDYEPYTKGPVTVSCFCKECRTMFAGKNKLPADINGAEILKKHKKAWVAFRCQQRADAVRTVVAGIKKINPKAKFGFCSMPFAPYNDGEYEETYGIKSPLYEDFIDFFNSMNYSGNLNFFRSLEREALELKKIKHTLINNGWGRPNNAKRLGMHLLAAFFCGEDYPGIAQGLYVSNGEQLRELRRAMDYTAATEKYWGSGKFCRSTGKVIEGFNASGNLYVLERKGNNGKSWLMLINNSERDDIFARLKCDPAHVKSITDLGTGKVMPVKHALVSIKLAPLSYRIFEYSAEYRKPSADVADHAKEESEALKKYREKISSGKKYGMSYSVTPEYCTISTPVHSLQIALRNSGEGVWKVKNKIAVSPLGRDVFMDKGVFNLGKRNIDIEDISITPQSIKVRFSFTVKDSPYAGLVFRREYTLHRSKPEINAYIEVVPAGGYRPFRLRTINNLAVAGDLNPHAAVSEVKSGSISDRNRFHISLVRSGAKFPDNKPFFSNKYIKKLYPLTGNTFTVCGIKNGEQLQITAGNIDQIFVWRAKNSATLELIWPDAYPHYDPHLIKTWKTNYDLKLTNI